MPGIGKGLLYSSESHGLFAQPRGRCGGAGRLISTVVTRHNGFEVTFKPCPMDQDRDPAVDQHPR